jgi:hypothetical protein
VSFGEESGSRNWDDARRYGFVSADGGDDIRPDDLPK